MKDHCHLLSDIPYLKTQKMPTLLLLISFLCGLALYYPIKTQAKEPLTNKAISLQNSNQQTVADAYAKLRTSLDESDQKSLQKILKQEFCDCQSPLSLDECLRLKPKCLTAPLIGQIVVRGLQQQLSEHQISMYLNQHVFASLCQPAVPVEMDRCPSQGSNKAPIHIVEFADFMCSHCKNATQEVHALLETYKNRIYFQYLPISLSGHPGSLLAAQAALAAHSQKKFWPMHQALFDQFGEPYTRQSIQKIAQSLGLNLKKFNNELDSHRHLATLEIYRKAALDLKLEGTPLFVINGRQFFAEPSLLNLKQRIELELKKDPEACQ